MEVSSCELRPRQGRHTRCQEKEAPGQGGQNVEGCRPTSGIRKDVCTGTYIGQSVKRLAWEVWSLGSMVGFCPTKTTLKEEWFSVSMVLFDFASVSSVGHTKSVFGGRNREKKGGRDQRVEEVNSGPN